MTDMPFLIIHSQNLVGINFHWQRNNEMLELLLNFARQFGIKNPGYPWNSKMHFTHKHTHKKRLVSKFNKKGPQTSIFNNKQ